MLGSGTSGDTAGQPEEVAAAGGAEQCSEQEGAELGWGGNGVDQVVGTEAPSHVDGWLRPCCRG